MASGEKRGDPVKLNLKQNMLLVIRTKAVDPLSVIGSVRAKIQSLDNNQPVYDVFTLRQIVGDSLAGYLPAHGAARVDTMIALRQE